MEFLKRYEKNTFEDLYWNIPETKQGVAAVIGGNGQSFRTPVKVAEYLGSAWPVREVRTVLPDALETKLPAVPGVIFLPSTESGSFAEGQGITEAINAVDFSLMVGDVSRNSITAKAVRSASLVAAKPLLITRDAVDAVAEITGDDWLMNENIVIMATVAQLVKVFRAAYYPRMLTLSQPLTQIAEGLHKFTLSYPVGVVTLAGDSVLIAKNGKVAAVPLSATGFSPLMLWGGECAAKIAAMNYYSPGDFISASVATLFRN